MFLVSGGAVFLWRLSANMPQLNADGLRGFSPNDWAAPALAYLSLSVYADLRRPSPEDGGSAAIWLARPATRAQEDRLVQAMAAARAAEYQALIAAAAEAAAASDPATRTSAVRRLRNELRGIQRRDYFPPAERDQAQAALQELAAPGARTARPARRADASDPARPPGETARQAQEEPS